MVSLLNNNYAPNLILIMVMKCFIKMRSEPPRRSTLSSLFSRLEHSKRQPWQIFAWTESNSFSARQIKWETNKYQVTETEKVRSTRKGPVLYHSQKIWTRRSVIIRAWVSAAPFSASATRVPLSFSEKSARWTPLAKNGECEHKTRSFYALFYQSLAVNLFDNPHFS